MKLIDEIIDSYCNLNLSFFSGWQKIKEVSDTSASSGVTTIIDYPLLRIEDHKSEAEWLSIRKRKLKRIKLRVDVGLVALLVPDIEEMKKCVDNGAIGLQVYLSPPPVSSARWVSSDVE